MTFDKKEVLKEFDNLYWVDPEGGSHHPVCVYKQEDEVVREFISTSLTQAYQAGRDEEREMIVSWLKFPYRDGMPPMEIKGLGKSEGGGCEVCGGELVMIRGKHPHTPDRKVCPTCATEIIEGLHDNLTQTSAAKENIDHLKETK